MSASADVSEKIESKQTKNSDNSEGQTHEHEKRSLLGPSRLKVNADSKPTTWRLLPLANLIALVVSLSGGGHLARMHSGPGRYLDVFDGYDRGTLLLASAGVCFVTSAASLAGTCATVGDLAWAREGRSKVMLCAHAWWSAGLLVMQFGVTALTYSTSARVGGVFKGGFFMSMLQYERNQEVQEKLNLMQMDAKCCGMNGHLDWFEVTWSDEVDENKVGFPRSCCDTDRFPLEDCVHLAVQQQTIKLTPWPDGCSKTLESFYLWTLTIITCIMASLAGFSIFSLVVIVISIVWVRKFRLGVTKKRMEFTEQGLWKPRKSSRRPRAKVTGDR